MLHIHLTQECILSCDLPVYAEGVIFNADADAAICLRGIEFPRQLLTHATP